MLENKMSRRNMLRTTGLAVLGSAFAGLYSCKDKDKSRENDENEKAFSSYKRPFRISINASTISGYKLPVKKQIDLCAKAGFDGIELWTRDVDAFIDQGGSYDDLRRQLNDSGLLLENMIGFATWFADDPIKRKDGLKQMQHDMEMVAQLGGQFIAATAQGVAQFDRSRLPEYAERYRTILDLGDKVGVTPILELWGAGVLNQLSDTMAMAIGAGHAKASVLLDFYHLYRGGNNYDSLCLVNGKMLPVFHINDFPDTPTRLELKDSDRVFPGDGICPFHKILPILYDAGFRGGLSVELFNKAYWKSMDVNEVLKMSFEKTSQVINRSLS
jgi:2-keto-myo-inositol isomerase